MVPVFLSMQWEFLGIWFLNLGLWIHTLCNECIVYMWLVVLCFVHLNLVAFCRSMYLVVGMLWHVCRGRLVHMEFGFCTNLCLGGWLWWYFLCFLMQWVWPSVSFIVWFLCLEGGLGLYLSICIGIRALVIQKFDLVSYML
jgi:hypothetical protein